MKTTLKGICILFVGLMVIAVFSRIGDALKTREQPAAKQGAAATPLVATRRIFTAPIKVSVPL